jgi:DNA-binding LacI/PurR family transcriptional regulator
MAAGKTLFGDNCAPCHGAGGQGGRGYPNLNEAIMLWGGTLDERILDALRRRNIPTVLVEGRVRPWLSVIGIDDRRGIAQVTEHLVGLGHTRIAAVTLAFGPDRASGFADAERQRAVQWDLTRRRLAGIRDAGVEPVAVYETAASLVEHGAQAGRALLTLPDRPTAIVCHSDLLAGGVVLAARELGLRVPEDVSVAGFDGLDLPWLAPDVLTTVAQPLAEKGRAAGRQAARLLDGEEHVSVELPVSLVVGTTTGPPPAG